MFLRKKVFQRISCGVRRSQKSKIPSIPLKMSKKEYSDLREDYLEAMDSLNNEFQKEFFNAIVTEWVLISFVVLFLKRYTAPPPTSKQQLFFEGWRQLLINISFYAMWHGSKQCGSSKLLSQENKDVTQEEVFLLDIIVEYNYGEL